MPANSFIKLMANKTLHNPHPEVAKQVAEQFHQKREVSS